MITESIRYLSYGPLPLIFFIFLGLFILSLRFGGWLYEKRLILSPSARANSSERHLLLSSVFGLLGLLIAFTFGLALNRHEERRQLVVHEANAIGSLNVIVGLLPNEHRREATWALISYSEERLSIGSVPALRVQSFLKKSSILREKLEDSVKSALSSANSPQQTIATLNNLNAVLAVGVEQDMLSRSRLPGSVAALLLCAALISSIILGMAMGSARKNWRIAELLLLTLMALSLVAILDLDRPYSGAIQISRAPLEDVVKSLKSQYSRDFKREVEHANSKHLTN